MQDNDKTHPTKYLNKSTFNQFKTTVQKTAKNIADSKASLHFSNKNV